MSTGPAPQVRCERGKVTQRPPICYTQFKYPLWVNKPNTIKIKLPGGNQFNCDPMNDVGNVETYLKRVQVYNQVLGKKNLRANLNAATKERKKLLKEMKKFLKVPKRETPENKVARELEVAATKVKLTKASMVHGTSSGACYDLFRQLHADDPQVQWDRIVREVHKVDPWTALDGMKHKGLRMKTSKLLKDCIRFHKRKVFSVDAAEQQKSYMMGSLK